MRPARQRAQAGLLQGVLGAIEIAGAADQSGAQAGPFATQGLLEQTPEQHQDSIEAMPSGRTSTPPSCMPGMRLAQSSAWSRVSTSIR